MANEQPQLPEVPISWVGFDELPILFANQLLVQSAGPRELVITFGQLTPPPIVGTIEEQREQLEEIPFVPVRPLVRLSVTHDRLREFIQVLQAQYEQHEQALHSIDPLGGTEPNQ